MHFGQYFSIVKGIKNIPTRSDVIKLIDQFDFNMLISYSRIITRRWNKLWYFANRTNLSCILSLSSGKADNFTALSAMLKWNGFSLYLFTSNHRVSDQWCPLIFWLFEDKFDWLMILLIWCEQKSCLLLLELSINVDKFLTLNKSITTKIVMHLLKFVKLLHRYSPDTNFIKFSVSNQIS